MTSKKSFKAAAVLLVALLSRGALAADVPGHYYLSGITEVGSELQLRGDGKFRWMLAYGAQDMAANGTWRQSGDVIELKATRNNAIFEDGTLKLNLKDDRLVPLDSPLSEGSYYKR